MRIPGWARVRRAARRTRNRVAPAPLILMYRRVAQLPADPQQSAVSPQHFAEHLEVLKKKAHPLSLTELVVALSGRKLPRRGVVVTFDDGYEDNLREAKPILVKHGAPATVYVTSGYVGRNEEFFWDELDRILLSPGTLPEALRLVVDGREFSWALRGAAGYSKSDAVAHRHWTVLDPAPTTRHTVYRSLCDFIRDKPHPVRQEVLDQLRAWAGVPKRGRPTHVALTPDGVRRLADGGLVEIGAHTVTHPRLPTLAPDEQLREIRQSKADLEDLLDRPVQHFAYPFGNADAYDEQTLAAVRDAGFASAACTVEGAVRKDTDPHQLPRHVVRDCAGDEFARHLREWFLNG